MVVRHMISQTLFIIIDHQVIYSAPITETYAAGA